MAMQEAAFALVCPFDKAPLISRRLDKLCVQCQRAFPLKRGVACFGDHVDAFYEGAYFNRVRFVPRSEALRHIWPVWLIRNGYLWAVRKLVPAGSRVVELGCASGIDYFASRYRMLACDVSLSSLQDLSSRYSACAQVDARTGLPVEDKSLDAIISSFFWEHLTPSDKSRVLAQAHAALRETGLLIFLYDISTENRLIGRMRRRQPQLYRRMFLEKDGHLGYQSLGENRLLFEEAGFEVLEHHSMERTCLQPPDVYQKLSAWPGPLRLVFQAGSQLSRAPLSYAYVALLRLVDVTVGRLFAPERGRVAITVCRPRRDLSPGAP